MFLWGILPNQGAYPSKSLFIIPAPFVSVINWLLKPIKPLEGIENSNDTLPKPWFCRFVILPFLAESFSVKTPTLSSGTSKKTFSMGSTVLPFSSLVITLGLETINSYPSLLMVSINTAICNSPLPLTSYASVLSVFKTCNETLLKISSSSLSLMCLVVRYFPSFPAKGLLFT